LTRTILPIEDYVKWTDMESVLELVQYMRNKMISFKIKWVTSTSPTTSTQYNLRKQTHCFHPKEILSRTWCNFREENHDQDTCDIKRKERKLIFFILRKFSQELGVIFVRRIMMRILVILKWKQENTYLEKYLIQRLFP